MIGSGDASGTTKPSSTAELVDLMYNWSAPAWKRSATSTGFTEGMKAYLDSEARRRNKFLLLIELSHRRLLSRSASGRHGGHQNI